jgi:hypothetical protein
MLIVKAIIRWSIYKAMIEARVLLCMKLRGKRDYYDTGC